MLIPYKTRTDGPLSAITDYIDDKTREVVNVEALELKPVLTNEVEALQATKKLLTAEISDIEGRKKDVVEALRNEIREEIKNSV